MRQSLAFAKPACFFLTATLAIAACSGGSSTMFSDLPNAGAGAVSSGGSQNGGGSSSTQAGSSSTTGAQPSLGGTDVGETGHVRAPQPV